MDTDRETYELVSVIVMQAHHLGMKMVAEASKRGPLDRSRLSRPWARSPSKAAGRPS
jgi:hypothetical protein